MRGYANELRMNSINSKFYERDKESADDAIGILKKSSPKLMIINFLKFFVVEYDSFRRIIYTLFILYGYGIEIIELRTIMSLIRSLWNFTGAMHRLTGALPLLH